MFKKTKIIWGLLLVLGGFLLTADDTEASRLYQKGLDQIKAKEYYDALKTFKEVEVVAKSNTIRANSIRAQIGAAKLAGLYWREFELIDGVPAMEKILAETDPVCVKMEADICWINRGGLNPPAFLRKYRTRINQVHVKDITVPDDTATTTELGKGVVDVKGSVQAAREIGVEWLIYEQDNSSDPFASAADSLKTLRALMA